MNVGVLGGTFDPIHKGHIIIAEEARAKLNLAEVLFVPAGKPWLKEGTIISPAEHRVRMVLLAIAPYPYFKLSAVEIERDGPSYTVETVALLKERLGEKDELFFILGQDNLAELPRWKDPSRLIEICRLVAVHRPGVPFPDMNALEKSIPGLSRRLVILDRPEVDISASDIRERVTKGLSIRRLVPEPVEEYVKQYNLYSGSS